MRNSVTSNSRKEAKMETSGIKEAKSTSQKWRAAKQAVIEQKHEALHLKETTSDCQTCGQNPTTENNHSDAKSAARSFDETMQQSPLQNHSVAQNVTEVSERTMQQSPL